jgi:uncharacterized protein (TIGR03663 family)
MEQDSFESPATEPVAPQGTPRRDSLLTRWAFWATFATVLSLAAVLRLYDLDLKPFHHDEGVNGSFLTTLYRTGAYRYDPTNYHGPSLYYAAMVSTFFFGLDTSALRLVTALFGLVTVWLALRARRLVGPVGGLAAALLLAVSPGAIFFSRYFIHEMLLIAATLGAVLSAERFLATRRLRNLLAASAWAALMFTTKETATPTACVLLGAAACALLYDTARQRNWSRLGEEIRARLASSDRVPLAISALSLFLLINLVLYSSFFTYPRGVVDALRALGPWAQTGVKAHVHPWWTYGAWLFKMEAPLLILGSLGLVAALVLGESRRVVFVAFWSLGIGAAYSIVPYKTPWLTLNMILPLALLAGYALDLLARRLPWLAGIVLLAASLPSLQQAVDLNLRRFDDDQLPYVYAHTQRGFLDLVQTVERIGTMSGQGRDLAITVVAKEHWPLPWYLRNYRHTGYHDNMEAARNSFLVICNRDQDERMRTDLGPAFDRLGHYALRPGVELILYVHTDRVSGRSRAIL